MTREQIKLLNLYSQYKYGVNFSEIVNFNVVEGSGVGGGPGITYGPYRDGYPTKVYKTPVFYKNPKYNSPEWITEEKYGGTYISEIPGRQIFDSDRKKSYTLLKGRVTNGEDEIIETSLGEIIDNPAEIAGSKNLTIGQAAKALMMSGALVRGLQTMGIVAGSVSTIATLIYVAKKHFDYNTYLQLCASNDMQPLNKQQYEGALKLLKQEKKFKDLKLLANYKHKKAGIKSDIKALKSGKKGMEKSAFREKLEELKEDLRQNKADYKSARSKLQKSYLADRKARYGHFYY